MIRQALIESKPPHPTSKYSPSAALIKALVIHYASNVEHGGINCAGWDEQLGWGMIDVDAVLQAITRRKAIKGDGNAMSEGFDDWKLVSRNKGAYSTRVKQPNIDGSKSSLKVAMVYSDRGSAIMQNSLLLSVNGQDADERPIVTNNVQQIIYNPSDCSDRPKISVEGTTLVSVFETQAVAVVWSWIPVDA